MLAVLSLLTFISSSLFVYAVAQRHRSVDYDVRLWTRQPRTTTTTTTTPSSQMCDRFDNMELTRRMRETGLYDPQFMAPDISTAAELFPDFGDKHYMRKYERYVCDAQCQHEANEIRRVMRKADPPPTDPPTQPPPVFVPNNNWWRNGFWTTSRNDYPQQVPFTRRKRQTDRAHKVIDDSTRAILRNSGTTKGVIGNTIAIECNRHTDADNVPSNLYQFCKSCTAVRQLPENYYPRILNEVICGEESCLKGNGKCQQRFLPFRVLQNVGTQDCQEWHPVTIQLRTCCDCMMDRSSVFLRYVLQE